MTADRLDALGRLMTAIADHVDAGQVVPCLNPVRGCLWISDDAEDQQAAALGCQRCPAIEPCRTYIEAHPEPAGIWAGRLRRNTQRREDQ